MVDGLEPNRTERPRTAEELAEVLRAAADAGEAVIPVGGGRALGLGDPPERFDLALETGGLDRVIELSQADLTASVEAGVTLEQLNEELGRAGQFLPADPFNAPGHTVGGLLAAALSGPLRLRYGTPRDYLIGLRVALPDGRLASSGGRVVKNVSGYDMNKLHLGALGSLGVIVAASFKVFPRPLHEVTLERQAGDLESALAEAGRAHRLEMAPIALELTSELRLLARVAGSASGVRRIASELGWAETGPEAWAEHARRRPAARLAVPPGRLPDLLRALPEGAAWWASPAVGVAYLAEPDLALRAAAEAAGGSLVLLEAPPELKREAGAWGSPPATLDLMRRLKDAFDPRRTLSPGRYLV